MESEDVAAPELPPHLPASTSAQKKNPPKLGVSIFPPELLGKPKPPSSTMLPLTNQESPISSISRQPSSDALNNSTRPLQAKESNTHAQARQPTLATASSTTPPAPLHPQVASRKHPAIKPAPATPYAAPNGAPPQQKEALNFQFQSSALANKFESDPDAKLKEWVLGVVDGLRESFEGKLAGEKRERQRLETELAELKDRLSRRQN